MLLRMTVAKQKPKTHGTKERAVATPLLRMARSMRFVMTARSELGVEVEQLKLGVRLALKRVLGRREGDVESQVRGRKTLQAFNPLGAFAPGEGRENAAALGDLHLEVFFLEEARPVLEAHFPAAKDRAGIVVAVRGQAFEVLDRFRSKIGERNLGVEMDLRDEIGRDKTAGGVLIHAPAQVADALGRKTEPGGLAVAAEAVKQVGARGEGIEQVKLLDRAPGTVADAGLDADDQRRTMEAVHEAAGDNPDDAAMPAFACDAQSRTG